MPQEVDLFTGVSQWSATLLLGLLDVGAPEAALQDDHATSLAHLLEALFTASADFELFLKIETLDEAPSDDDWLITCYVEAHATLAAGPFLEALEAVRPGLAAAVLNLISDTSVLLPVYTPAAAFEWLETVWWGGSWTEYQAHFQAAAAKELGGETVLEHDLQTLIDQHGYSLTRVAEAIPTHAQRFAPYQLQELQMLAENLPFLRALLELLVSADTDVWEKVLRDSNRLDDVWTAYPLVLETSEDGLVSEMHAEQSEQAWQNGLLCAFTTFAPREAGALVDVVRALDANTALLSELSEMLKNFTCLEVYDPRPS